VDRNPEMIVIMDYGSTTIDQKKQTLLNHSALADVEAIKNERFSVMPLVDAFEGIRIPIALETLAESFIPKRLNE